MRCGELEARVNELLDARLPLAGDSALGEHARVCPDCRELLAAYQELFQVVGPGTAGADTTPDVAPRVLAALRSSSAESVARVLPSRSVGWLLAACATAAAVLLLAALWGSWQKSEPVEAAGGRAAPGSPQLTSPSNRHANSLSANGAHEDAVTGGRPAVHVDVARAAEESYRALAQETSKRFSDVAMLMPSTDDLPANQAADLLPRIAPNMAEGFKPVMQSTAGTFGMFMRVFPSSPPKKRESPRSKPPGSTVERTP